MCCEVILPRNKVKGEITERYKNTLKIIKKVPFHREQEKLL